MQPSVYEGIVSPVAVKQSYLSLLGPPGAGKTTFAEAMTLQIGAAYFSTSAFLSEILKSRIPEPERKHIESSMALGKNIDLDSVHQRILDALEKLPGDCKVVDGFPRTPNALNALRKNTYGTASLVIFHVFSDIKSCRERFLSKGDDYTNSVFDERLRSYTEIERPMLSAIGGAVPIIDVRT